MSHTKHMLVCAVLMVAGIALVIGGADAFAFIPALGCALTEHQFSITEERNSDSGADTARFLAAGARRSLWVRTKQGELATALPALTAKIEADEFVIVESNSLRRFITPMGYGKTEFVSDNTTAAGRAQNRRVEVKILINRGMSRSATTRTNP